MSRCLRCGGLLVLEHAPEEDGRTECVLQRCVNCGGCTDHLILERREAVWLAFRFREDAGAFKLGDVIREDSDQIPLEAHAVESCSATELACHVRWKVPDKQYLAFWRGGHATHHSHIPPLAQEALLSSIADAIL